MFGLSVEELLEFLRRLRSEDPSYVGGEVLGSMSTEPPKYLLEAYNIFVNTNLNDPVLFRNTYRLELECVEWLSKLMYGSGYGLLTYGGTESNLTALYILREFSGGDTVIAPKTVHVSIRKACKVLKLNFVEVGVGEDYIPDVDELCNTIRRYEGRIACVVMTAGTTDLGIVEPVDKLVSTCGDADYVVHVDAAYGGLITQFISDLDPNIPVYDFRLSKVYTITVDLHKVFTPIPCSALLLRSKELEDFITFEAPYMPLGKQRSLLGTRTGGIAATAWLAIKSLGYEGFKQLVHDLVRRADYLSSRLADLGVEVLRRHKLPIVAFRVGNARDVMRRLWDLRMYVYPTSIPNTLRVVVGPHITYEVIDRFVGVLANMLNK